MMLPVHPPTLTLYSVGLLGKWGFNDGDEPEHFLDWWDDHEPDIDYVKLEWHPVLRHLVRSYLLPALRETHVIEVYDIETIHNPIRARTVDGHPIDDYADNDHVTLSPAEMTLSYDVVTRAVRELGLPHLRPPQVAALE
jgi:hypothetical protein